jgi:hypothetical protein
MATTPIKKVSTTIPFRSLLLKVKTSFQVPFIALAFEIKTCED